MVEGVVGGHLTGGALEDLFALPRRRGKGLRIVRLRYIVRAIAVPGSHQRDSIVWTHRDQRC